jgi:hypothetical protein
MSIVIGLLGHTLDVEVLVVVELELVVVGFVSMVDRERLVVHTILFDPWENIMEVHFSYPNQRK